MSHHFDSPTGREDPRLNLCDVYVFAGGADTTVMALTVNPAATPETAMPFRGEAIYTFNFDTDLDRHQNVSFAAEFASSSNADDGTVQTFTVRRVVQASHGQAGDVLASGVVGASASGTDGVRAFAGVVHDPFAGDAAALNAFKGALQRGEYRPTSFDNHVNYFRERTVAAIVVEVPTDLISQTPRVDMWATVTLHGHAPDQQVSRWGLPLFTHIFLRDDELREQFNRAAPPEDEAAFVSSTVDTVTRYVTASGAATDPSAYARRVAELFGSFSLPYELGTAASFDFAGFNGRALNDNVMDVMLTLLVNAPLSTGIRPDPARFATEWPYLLPAAPGRPTTHPSRGGK
ncbi:DUF4331 family protein [Mycobacterium sp.]|uniref:DUF4331 family protein n=1 Tax=Mycobacterium sp. TaxID=1785 RepID=UPI003D11C20D